MFSLNDSHKKAVCVEVPRGREQVPVRARHRRGVNLDHAVVLELTYIIALCI